MNKLKQKKTIQAHYQSNTVTLMHKCMKQAAPQSEVCLLDLKSIRMMKGREGEGGGGGMVVGLCVER